MKRLLFISHRVPYPPEKSERVRAFHEIRALSERFRVTVAALSNSQRVFSPHRAVVEDEHRGACGGDRRGPCRYET